MTLKATDDLAALFEWRLEINLRTPVSSRHAKGARAGIDTDHALTHDMMRFLVGLSRAHQLSKETDTTIQAATNEV